MKRFLLVISIITLLFCLFQQAHAQNQIFVNGATTAPINFPVAGCVYNWVNSNPAIGLPASGTGTVPSFKAVNTGNSPITATILATPVPTGFAYIANENSNNISVISTVTHSVLTTIPVGRQPNGVAVSPDATRVYVANNLDNSVSVIDAVANSVIAVVPVGKNPFGIVVSPDGSKVYVANSGTGTISIIDAATNAFSGTIPGIAVPLAIEVSPDGKFIYVTSNDAQQGSSFTVISTATNAIVSTLPIGTTSYGMAISPDGSKVYVTNTNSSTVTVIDPAANSISTIIPLNGNPAGITILPDGSRAYVASSNSGEVYVINMANNAISAITTGGNTYGISASADGKEVYATNQNQNSVTVINTANNSIKQAINVGSFPVSIGHFTSPGPGCNSLPATFTITINNTVPLIPAPGISYVTPQVYNQYATITPLSPSNSGGAVPAAVFGRVTTFAGSGVPATVDGVGTAASFSIPIGVAVDASGNVFVPDNDVIRKIAPDGTVSTYAGTHGVPGSTDGSLTSATFRNVTAIAFDKAGNMYVVDESNNNIRKITPGGIVTTLAGATDRSHGYLDGPGNKALFSLPFGIAVDLSGNLYVGESGNHVIRKITPTGVVSTYAGTGIIGANNGPANTATFNTPTGVALDAFGNLYVAEYNNNLIRKITPDGIVSTFAGSGTAASNNGTGTAASFFKPSGVIVDGAGNLYVTEITDYIRKITPVGMVTTFAGNGNIGNTDGIGPQASFNYPTGVAIDGGGNLYIADDYNRLIRRGEVAGYSIDKDLPAGLVFDRTNGKISGTPTVASPATDYTVTAYNAGGSSSTIVNIKVNTGVLPPPPAPNISYVTPQVYTQNTAITPLVPQNLGGAVPATIYGNVTTVAGSGQPGSANGIGKAATFKNPVGVITDAAGNIYIGDSGNNEIRKITPAGVVSTFAGNTTVIGADDGTGAAATFNVPRELAIDQTGTIYVADFGSSEIRKISPGAVVNTLAGNFPVQGSANGLGKLATFTNPNSIVVDAAGNVYVADTFNYLIRKITPQGLVTTFAGSGAVASKDGIGTAASFLGPISLTLDKNGNLFVTDNATIRKITPGRMVTTFAGNLLSGVPVDGTGTAASLGPMGITTDQIGNMYVADAGYRLIRKITPAAVVTTIAGSGAQVSTDGVGKAAGFRDPWGITYDPTGNLYVTDYSDHIVREVSITGYTIDKPLPAGLIFDATTGTISGTPTVVSPATDYTITAYNTGGSSTAVVNIKVLPNTTPATTPPIISYVTPQVYPINSAIAPLSPSNTGGAVPATAYGQVTTFAGNAQPGITDGLGLSARFRGPIGMVTDVFGNMFVSDFNNNAIRKITPAGIVSTITLIGLGNQAFNPTGITVDGNGNLYVADPNNNRICKIDNNGNFTVFAGGTQGSTDGQGTAASFNHPEGVTIDNSGNIYVADTDNQSIRKIDQNGVVSTFIIGLSYPNGLAFDENGNLYVVNTGESDIKKITPTKAISTIAGGATEGATDGTGAAASFNGPRYLVIDKVGNIYVTDNGNNLIRKITPSGVVTTIAGNANPGAIDGTGSSASFNNPHGITIDDAGNLYIADYNNNEIRKISTYGYTIDKPLPAGLTFDPTTGTITGTPTAASPATDYTVTAYNAAGSSSTVVNLAVIDNTVQPPVITYQSPQVYTKNKSISPLAPSNSGGAVSNTDYTMVSTYLNPATPSDMTFDTAGNLYVVEFTNHDVLKITPGGVKTIFAGPGATGPNAGSSSAGFFAPYGIAIDPSGNVFVVDEGNSTIRKITPDGKMTTFAGNGTSGTVNGLGTAASFNHPLGIVSDAAGNLYVTDRGNSTIRQISPNGSVSTFAVIGNGAVPATEDQGLGYITIDKNGNLYFTDHNQVKMINQSRQVTIIAGGTFPGFANGTGTSAAFHRLVGIKLDVLGNLYIGDADNNMVRKVTPAGVVTTVAGSGIRSFLNGSVTTSTFFAPYGLAIDKAGNIFVCDAGNSAIRKISKTKYSIDKPLPAGLTFDTETGIISGTPTVISPATEYTITGYNSGGSSSAKLTITVNSNVTGIQAPVITYPTPNVYTTNTTIAPLVPNTSGGGAVPAVIFGVTTTFTGRGTVGNNNGAPLDVTFRFPVGVAIDAAGNLYIADYNNNLIRKAAPDGTVITFAGNGTQGQNNGTALQASFNRPIAVAIDAAGNIYVADYNTNVIRKITPAGIVSTLAGSGITGFNNGTGITASFNHPSGIVVDAAGNIYVADKDNNVIRMITPAGVVSTFAGSGAAGSTNATGLAASFKGPQALVIDPAGNIYVSDSGNNLIRMITPAGLVSNYAGSGQQGNANGPVANASFNNPVGLAIDLAGNIFVADSGNNLIRMITADGTVTTLAGNGTFGGFNNTGVVASFAGPTGLAVDPAGNLFVADKFNNVIREIATTGYYIDKQLPQGLKFDSMTGIISGTPLVPTPTTIYTITAYNEGGHASFQVSITVNESTQPPLVKPPAFIYQTPQVYTVNTAIAPLSPQDNGGGPVPATIFGDVSTFAGSGTQGAVNNTGTAASFNFPHDVTIDRQGNLYVADNGNYLIRAIAPGGLVSTLAGSGAPGSANGNGTAASFLGPVGVTTDIAGNIYVADLKNNLIRKIAPPNQVSTLAGSMGISGSTNGTGTAASFNNPSGVAADAAGNIYVADPGNNLIRRVTPDGTVSTLAGSGIGGANNATGIQATFNSPGDVAVDKDGNVYVADDFNNMIRKVTPAGVVSTFAGSTTPGKADGQGTAASFNRPVGIAIDAAGNLYVGDTGNNTVRMITPGGLVTTLAGSGAQGAVNGARFAASFYMPSGLTADANNNVYLADNGNHLIRKIVATGYTIDKTLPAGLTFDGTTGTISGTPTTVSPATDYIVTGYNAGGSGSFTISIEVKDIVLVPQTITFEQIEGVTYGDDDFDPGATSTNTTIPITYTSSDPSVITIVDGKIHITGKGSSTITASQAGNSNYIPAQPVQQEVVVDKALLIITPDDKTKTVGDVNPPLTISYYGFVYNEDISQLTALPVATTIATTDSPVGQYLITADGAAAKNYTFDYVPGTLTVNAPLVTIVIPNAFTPNGDGINDVWNIKSLIDYPDCIVSIYTRYGGLVYQSKGYPAPWDGTTNGKQLPVGTYYYIINPKSGIKQMAGYVTIIR